MCSTCVRLTWPTLTNPRGDESHSQAHTPTSYLGRSAEKSQYMPLCGSQTSLSLHACPICRAQLLQQPHPSRTELTPGAHWGLSRHLQGHWQNCRLSAAARPSRRASSCPLFWALLKHWGQRQIYLMRAPLQYCLYSCCIQTVVFIIFIVIESYKTCAKSHILMTCWCHIQVFFDLSSNVYSWHSYFFDCFLHSEYIPLLFYNDRNKLLSKFCILTPHYLIRTCRAGAQLII